MGDIFGKGGDNSAPPQRDLSNEIQQILGQGPAMLQSEQQLSPGYTTLGLQNLNLSLNGQNGTPGLLSQYTGQIVPAQNAAASATRTATYNDLRGFNPAASAGYDQLLQGATNQYALGSQLDPNATALARQGVNSNWYSRGLGTSMPAGLDQAMQLYGGGQALQQQRMANLGGALQQGNSMYNLPALGYGGTGGAQSFFSTAGNTTTNAANQGNVVGALGSYASDLFNTNYNAQNARYISQMNNEGSMFGSLLGAGATLGSAAMLM